MPHYAYRLQVVNVLIMVSIRPTHYTTLADQKNLRDQEAQHTTPPALADSHANDNTDIWVQISIDATPARDPTTVPATPIEVHTEHLKRLGEWCSVNLYQAHPPSWRGGTNNPTKNGVFLFLLFYLIVIDLWNRLEIGQKLGQKLLLLFDLNWL